jgi:hypothetical protein
MHFLCCALLPSWQHFLRKGKGMFWSEASSQNGIDVLEELRILLALIPQ